VSVPKLLAEVQTGLGGSVVAFAGSRTGQRLVLEPATGTLDTPPGDRVPIAVPGFEDWSIAIRSRPVQFDPPFQLLLLAVLLGTAAVSMVWWLARQVVAPAEQLAQQRDRLGQLYQTARSDALEDSLTGLGNHRAFMEEFDRQLEGSRRYKTPLSLLLIDLDDFKLVNDSAGHAVGDQMLVEMGRLLRSALRRPDRSFRIGGDEFAVLMPHTESAGALLVGRRLLAACIEPRPASAFPRPFAFSGGISASPELSSSRSELFGQADAALYECKRHGRTTVAVFDPTRAHPNLDPQARSDLSAKVARVVAVGALKAVYQPIVDLRTGRVIGFEGLVRPAPDSGFESAVSLFTAAEETGRTFELDRACIEAVIRGARQIGRPDAEHEHLAAQPGGARVQRRQPRLTPRPPWVRPPEGDARADRARGGRGHRSAPGGDRRVPARRHSDRRR
jgi:diguanylate cyclase (GGDEF)-like protein